MVIAKDKSLKSKCLDSNPDFTISNSMTLGRFHKLQTKH